MNYTSPKSEILAISSEFFCASFYLGGGGVYGEGFIIDNGEY